MSVSCSWHLWGRTLVDWNLLFVTTHLGSKVDACRVTGKLYLNAVVYLPLQNGSPHCMSNSSKICVSCLCMYDFIFAYGLML